MERDFVSYKLRTGDEEAFNFIFNNYYEGLVLFALDFINDRDQAEEIVQGVFVKIWENHKTLDIKISIKSYLLKAVQNRCYDYIKHHKIKIKFEELFLQKTIKDEITNDYFSSNLIRRIDIAIDNLPEKTGHIFRMSRFENMKYKEIAEQLNISIKTVEANIGRALQQLRIDLKDWL